MATIELENLREEICHALRNGDIFGAASTTIRGVTNTTNSFTAGAGDIEFTLSHTGVKNIRSLTIDSVDKYLFRDYTVNWATGKITLNTPTTGGEDIEVSYDYSSSADKIYPDMPRTDLTLTSFPRVGIELTSSRTEPLGLGGLRHISDLIVTAYVWVPVNKDTNIAGGLGGTSDLNNTIKRVRDALRTTPKSYYNFPYIYPMSTSPIITGQDNKIIQMSQDFNVRFVVE